MSRLPGSSDVFADPEAFWRLKGLSLIAGVDEVGRGPLAGPVVAAAVILPENLRISGLADSKCLTPEVRADLDRGIRATALALAVRELGARQIESLGILKATLRAMAQAVAALHPAPQLVLVDGDQPLPLTFPQQPVIKGDALCPSISAASIVAKVYRDSLMERLHQRYPQVQFRPPQGLRHRRTPGGPALLGAVRAAPPHLPGR